MAENTQTSNQWGGILPDVGYFIIDNYKYKYAVPWVYPIDCAHYESRSGLTFYGCMKVFIDDFVGVSAVDLSGGLYGSPHEPKVELRTRAKMTRNKGDILHIFKDLYNNYVTYKNSNVYLVQYDNYSISVFDKFFKAKDVPMQYQRVIFEKSIGSDIVRIFTLKRYEPTKEVSIYDYLTDIVDNGIRFTTDKEAMVELWISETTHRYYYAILLYIEEPTKLTMKEGYTEITEMINEPGLYLIFVR